jgi:hypothetical protein
MQLGRKDEARERVVSELATTMGVSAVTARKYLREAITLPDGRRIQ